MQGRVIALHSIGEMALDERAPFEDVDARAYLIGYKSAYGGVDNDAYFWKFKMQRQHLDWWDFQPWIELGKVHWDLIGG